MRAYLWATLDEGVRGRGVSHTGLMGMVESECAVRTMWCVYGVRHGREREHGSVRASAFNILNMLLLAVSPTFFSCASCARRGSLISNGVLPVATSSKPRIAPSRAPSKGRVRDSDVRDADETMSCHLSRRLHSDLAAVGRVQFVASCRTS